MLTTEQINDLHRLYWSEHWPIRKIERHLNRGWKTIRKYLDASAQGPVHRDRPSKLDPFQGAIAEWLEKDPGVSAAVIEQKLRAAGYQGGHSILREYVRNVRPHIAPKRAFVRMEPLAGERFEVDDQQIDPAEPVEQLAMAAVSPRHRQIAKQFGGFEE